MNLLFNKDNQGQKELKELLGFLDANFTYNNLKSDLELNTPDLLQFIGQSTYDKLYTYYIDDDATPDTLLDRAIRYTQLYIASMAYLDFAPNHDLTHGNDGRNARSENNEKTPWDWQIERDNAALYKRAYKALDQLMVVLDGSEWTEWISSEAYKKANRLLLNTTQEFDDVLPINKSGQLFYRMVSFMEDIEEQEICSVIGREAFLRLRAGDDLTEDDKDLLKRAQKVTAHFALARAYKSLPIEMFGTRLTSRHQDKERLALIDRKVAHFNALGEKYLALLENNVSRINAAAEQEAYEPTDPAAYIGGDKHVNL